MRLDSRGRRIFFAIMFVCVISMTAWAADDSPFFPLSDIRPGMRGKGYTVISGTKVEEFSVKVLGVYPGQGPVRNYIFVRVYGKNVEDFGGIAAGMSGSPVFVRGKLLGAISHGMVNADPQYGLITPIEDMARIWSYEKKPSESIELISSHPFSQSKLTARPVMTPMGISGLGERAFRELEQVFPNGLFQPMRVPGTKHKPTEGTELIPGSAIGVQLVSGDYEVTATGTLTWIDNEQFLAFGHPFLNKGTVDYFVTGAEVIQIIPSNTFPFKVAIPLQVVGRLSQDRGAGIAGHFRQVPQIVPVKFSVSELGRGRAEDFEFFAVHDHTLLRGLIIAGGLESVDRWLDRIGPGMAKVSFRLTGDDIQPIERTNIFFGQDVAASALKELNRFLDTLLTNEYTSVRLRKVEVEIEIDEQRRTARVDGASFDTEKQRVQGEKFQVKVQLQPYRREKTQVTLDIDLPENLPTGRYMLSVRGGSQGLVVEDKEGENKDLFANPMEITDLNSLITYFTSQPTNNMIVVEAIPFDGATEGVDNSTSIEIPKWSVSTEFYLSGETQMIFEVFPK